MEVTETALDGVLIVTPDVHGDTRGYFMETHQLQRYAESQITLAFVQDNLSYSQQGVLRGLHFQNQFPQGKLVTAISGQIWDVAVDINPDSKTFRQWVGVVLDDSNHRQLYIPPGYAHGFVVLSKTAHVYYKCTDFYRPSDEMGIAWNDATLNVGWPVTDPQISGRDAASPTLNEYLASI